MRLADEGLGGGESFPLALADMTMTPPIEEVMDTGIVVGAGDEDTTIPPSPFEDGRIIPSGASLENKSVLQDGVSTFIGSVAPPPRSGALFPSAVPGLDLQGCREYMGCWGS
jgi:hypothetical protein